MNYVLDRPGHLPDQQPLLTSRPTTSVYYRNPRHANPESTNDLARSDGQVAQDQAIVIPHTVFLLFCFNEPIAADVLGFVAALNNEIYESCFYYESNHNHN